MKTVGGFRRTRYRGLDRTGLAGYLVGTAYNLVRMARLMTAETPSPTGCAGRVNRGREAAPHVTSPEAKGPPHAVTPARQRVTQRHGGHAIIRTKACLLVGLGSMGHYPTIHPTI